MDTSSDTSSLRMANHRESTKLVCPLKNLAGESASSQTMFAAKTEHLRILVVAERSTGVQVVLSVGEVITSEILPLYANHEEDSDDY